jgi:hypothetical protein
MEYFPQKKAAIAIQFNTDYSRALKKGTRGYILEFAKILFDATPGGK